MRNHIKGLRIARGSILQAMADHVNASNQHLSHLEIGKRRLTVDWIERLATAMVCDPLELLSANVAEVTEQNEQSLTLLEEVIHHLIALDQGN